MKAWEIVGIAVGGFFAWSLWQKYEAGSTLQVNFSSVDFSNFPTVNVVLSCQNVTNTPLTINSLAGNISVQGQPFGSVSLTTPVTIAPNEITNVPFSVAVSLLSLPSSILNVMNAANGSVQVNITGNVNVAGIPAPVAINETQMFTV